MNNVNSFTYRGRRFPNVTILERGRSYSAPRSNDVVSVPGRPGALFRRRNIEPLQIPLKILVDSVPGQSFAQTAAEFAEWLNAEEPAALVFDSDDLKRTYYGIVDGGIDAKEVVQYAVVDITFICYDPHAYGPTQYKDITGSGIVPVGGTAPSVPVFEIMLTGPTTFVAVGSEKDINMVGTPANADQATYVREERKVWDQMSTLTGWGATNVSEDGPVVGTIVTSAGAFKPSSFSTGAGWHGPGLKRPIGTALQDFRVETDLSLTNAKGTVGAVHVVMLDAANNVIAKLFAGKYNEFNDEVVARVVVGKRGDGPYAYNGSAKSWNKSYFGGKMMLERVGDRWTMKAIRYTDAMGWHGEVTNTITWTKPAALAPVAQVQVNFWQYGTKKTPTMEVSDIKVFKINERPEEIPIIGDAGDVFTFDHELGDIQRNGISIVDRKAFVGEYFKLPKGQNALTAQPENVIGNANVRWRDRWI